MSTIVKGPSRPPPAACFVYHGGVQVKPICQEDSSHEIDSQLEDHFPSSAPVSSIHVDEHQQVLVSGCDLDSCGSQAGNIKSCSEDRDSSVLSNSSNTRSSDSGNARDKPTTILSFNKSESSAESDIDQMREKEQSWFQPSIQRSASYPGTYPDEYTSCSSIAPTQSKSLQEIRSGEHLLPKSIEQESGPAPAQKVPGSFHKLCYLTSYEFSIFFP